MVRACCEAGMEMRSKKGLVDALKKQSAVPTSSCDEPPGKQSRRNPTALINYFSSNPCIISTSF